MKDIIWTLIIIWFIYKLVEVFQSVSKRTTQSKAQPLKTDVPKHRNRQEAHKKHLNNEGEYVDFEEL